MTVAAMEIRLYAPWVHSLKEKRMLVQSLLSKTRNQFNVSAAEVDMQEMHQTLVLGIACVSNDTRLNESVLENVLALIERSTDAEIVEVLREVRL